MFLHALPPVRRTLAATAGAVLTVLALVPAAPAFAADAAAASRRPIAHEDVWLAQRVGAPAVSPDGRWAVFAVTEPAYDRKDQSSDLWLVPVDGSAKPRRITSSSEPESGVTWSADAKRIAFAAKRTGDDVAQVYVLDLAAGGEAIRVTDAPLGARTPKFSPDGTRILYVADAWPGAKDEADNARLQKERKERKANVRVYETFPIRNWDKWLDERQPRVYVRSLEAGSKSKDLLAGSQLLRERGYAGRMSDEGGQLDAEWTPDGSGIVFVASVNRNAAARAFTNSELWLVSADGGEPKRLTQGTDSWGDPRFSADGTTLYAERTPQKGDRVYNATLVAVMDWRNGDPDVARARNLTTAVDRSVTSWGVGTDGTLWFLAEDAGHEKLYVAAPGQPARLAFDMDAGVYTSLSVAEGAKEPVLVARWESAVSPAEVVRIDPAKGHVALSDFNAARAAEIDWQPVEHFWFTSSRGRKIHNMLVKPPGFDPLKKYPLFVMIHGGPHTMWRDQFFLRWNYHLIARPGFVILLTNYSGSTGFGEKFAQSIQGDPLKGPGEELNQAADEAIRRYSFVDGSRQCAGGASYGGHLSNWLQASTTRYRCLISHAGLLDLRSQWSTSDSVYHREVNVGGPPWSNSPLWRTQSPFTYATKFRTPVLVTIGEKDYRVPLNNALEYWTVLQRQQVPGRLVVFPDQNHWILTGEDSRVFYREIQDWLTKYLLAGQRGEAE
jgi:dipeptidyl aminopeptidase/acylaminoacyl peptidase